MEWPLISRIQKRQLLLLMFLLADTKIFQSTFQPSSVSLFDLFFLKIGVFISVPRENYVSPFYCIVFLFPFKNEYTIKYTVNSELINEFNYVQISPTQTNFSYKDF